MHYVIAGAGPAGVIAAETLRRQDPQGDISLLDRQQEPPYSRMAIPYYLVGNIEEAGTYLRKESGHFEKLGIERVAQGIQSVQPADRHITLDDGSRLQYDRLLLATGSRPLVPPIPGIEHENVTSCWDLEHARHIVKLAKPGAKVVLIGAGFIGCIILEALALNKVELAVVEMGDRMVPRMMNATAGAMIKAWCEEKGVAVYTGTQVEAIDSGGGGSPLSVKLSDGKTLPADLVITATGVAANIDYLEGSGVETDQGILVDEYLQSSDPNIFAAGDCAQGRDFSTGERSVHAIQPTAVEHGRIAAQNMAGGRIAYQGSINMNVLDTLGLISTSFGLWMGVEGGDSVELHNPEQSRYLNLQFQDDVLVGATCVGLTEHVGVLRGLIQTRVPLGEWKEKLRKEPARLMEAYLACRGNAPTPA
ncbi:MAG: FAD-dependent oxidoreductase [Gammaproteobacteria bacterium]